MRTPSVYQFIPNSFGLSGSLVSILPDFISVFSDLKPCASGVIKLEEIDGARELCRRHNLKIDFSDFKLAISSKSTVKTKLAADHKGGQEWRQVFISKSDKILKQAKAAHFEHTFYKGEIQTAPRSIIKNYGKILGYPQCCAEHLIQCDYDRKFDNAVSGACRNTKIFHHELNNLAYFHYYIPYFPCAYDCRESFEYAEKLKKEIKKIEPNIYDATEKYLKLPYLFLAYNVGIVFNGAMEKEAGTVSYSDFDIIGPVGESLLSALDNGNRCRILDDKIEISRDLEIVNAFSRDNKEKEFMIIFK